MKEFLTAEYPRPDFQRETFFSLNGIWSFAFDDKNEGLSENWQESKVCLPLEIRVPFCFQSKASGIGTDEIHPVIWYRRSFCVPDEMQGKRLWLRFGAVDYACRVFVNGREAGSHTGGYSPFGFDITPYLRDGENDLRLRVEDAPDCSQPRGKQYWQRGLMGCWYTPVSGIWQSVYLEATGPIALKQIHITPDIDNYCAKIALTLDRACEQPAEADCEISFNGTLIRHIRMECPGKTLEFSVDMRDGNKVDSIRLWSPESPSLYDVTVRLLSGGEMTDTVRTYFGMRKIEVAQGRVLLNNMPLYQRLVLDQGYWRDTLLTPPDGDALRADVEAIKAFGFNGVRKHQKLEDPRFYYWCDRLGLLVWGEVPSTYVFTDESIRNLSQTLLDFIARDYNHPSIITWVPLNESWGVREIYTHPRQQALARMLCQICKAADGTRLVSSNDGWEQTETDICALHDYAAWGDTLYRHFESRGNVERSSCDRRMAYAKGVSPTGNEAFLITEYGGIAMTRPNEPDEMGGIATWGYHDKVESEEAFFARYQSLNEAIRRLPYCRGYCYTQLTDVMQEINGLLTCDRKPKIDPARFREMNRNPDSL